MKTFLLIFSTLLCGQVFADQPDWVNSGVIEKYQNNLKYVTAVGDGETSGDADKLAFSRLAEQIQVSISSQSIINQEYHSTAGKVERREDVNINIKTSVDLEDIEGILIAGRYFNEASKTYYAFAVLDKVKTATRLSFKIESQFDQIRSQQSDAKKLINSGQASKGITNLARASQSLETIQEDLSLHRLFANTGMQSLHGEEFREITTKFDQYLTRVFNLVNVKVVNGDEKPGSPELGVEEPYLVEFSYNGRALKQVPVAIETDTDGMQIDADQMTDKRGALSVQVRSLPYTGSEQNRIRVKLAIYDQLFNNRSPSAQLVVLLDQKSDVAIRLISKINSRAHQYLGTIVNDGLAAVLSDQNYNVTIDDGGDSSRSGYVLETLATVVEFPGFSGMSFSKINGVIRIKSASTNRVLKTIRINADKTKAGALSSADSAEKAAGQLIDAVQDELLETLENNIGRN